jgi:glycosyltransferase involved in cell wall biosynthesis
MFQIIGAGTYFKPIQELSRVTNKIILTSKIPYKEVLLRLLSSDIFVFPTRYEGHSIVLLEAMAAGNAIIASKLPSIEETLNEEEGFLINCNEPIEVWCKTLEELLINHKLLKERQELARKRSFNFPLEKTLKETIKVYYETISNN